MIVGIGGASRSGKSTLAHAIKKRNQELSIAIISQDDYAFPEINIPKIKDQVDWECPASINVEKFRQAIDYSNVNYDITIAEGLLLFHFEELLELFDKIIFIEIDNPTFVKRKKDDRRWGEIPEWYKDHIWDSYLKYGKLNSTSQDALIINGNSETDIKHVQHFLDFPTTRNYLV